MNFEEWLNKVYKKANGKPLAPRSIEHYLSGLSIISSEMIDEMVINKPLEEMDLIELDSAISVIMKTESFKIKDTIGNNMYSNALKKYRCFLFHNTDLEKKEEEEIEKLKNDKNISTTEKERLIKARKGQGLFRKRLIEKYNNRCIITDIGISQVLVASHIKPWAVSNNEERLSINNGLLLSATYDRLFDGGLITIKKDGKIIISNIISKEDLTKLHLKKGQVFDIKYVPEMETYLKYHNDVIFIGDIK